MEELKQFFEDIHRIADGVEQLKKGIMEDNKNFTELCESAIKIMEEQEENENSVQSETITSGYAQTIAMPVSAQQSIAENTTVMQTAIPVSNTVESYTQDQLAVAMGRAIDAGKMGDIQKILSDFGVASLVEVPTERYNDLVLRLKQIGVDV